jgi:hypothetical protein
MWDCRFVYAVIAAIAKYHEPNSRSPSWVIGALIETLNDVFLPLIRLFRTKSTRSMVPAPAMPLGQRSVPGEYSSGQVKTFIKILPTPYQDVVLIQHRHITPRTKASQIEGVGARLSVPVENGLSGISYRVAANVCSGGDRLVNACFASRERQIVMNSSIPQRSWCIHMALDLEDMMSTDRMSRCWRLSCWPPVTL